jgi:hypothetical protein
MRKQKPRKIRLKKAKLLKPFDPKCLRPSPEEQQHIKELYQWFENSKHSSARFGAAKTGGAA